MTNIKFSLTEGDVRYTLLSFPEEDSQRLLVHKDTHIREGVGPRGRIFSNCKFRGEVNYLKGRCVGAEFSFYYRTEGEDREPEILNITHHYSGIDEHNEPILARSRISCGRFPDAAQEGGDTVGGLVAHRMAPPSLVEGECSYMFTNGRDQWTITFNTDLTL